MGVSRGIRFGKNSKSAVAYAVVVAPPLRAGIADRRGETIGCSGPRHGVRTVRHIWFRLIPVQCAMRKLNASRRRRLARLVLAVVGCAALAATVLSLERRRPVFELERAGAAVVQDVNGNARTVSFCHPAAGDAHLRLIAQLPTLTSVNLARSSVTPQGLRALAALPHLHTLDLSETPAGAGSLDVIAEFPALQTLQLRRCAWLTDDTLRPLARLKTLECLMIAEGDLTDASLELLAGLPSLKQLGIDRCQRVTDDGLRLLRERSQLESLSVNDCRHVTDTGLCDFAGLKSLRSLTACGIPMRRPVLRQLATLNPDVGLVLDRFDIPEWRPLLEIGAQIGLDGAYNISWIEIDDRRHDPQILPPYSQMPQPDDNPALVEADSQPVPVSDTLLETLTLVPETPVLYLRNLSLTDAGFARIAQLPRLHKLVVENVPISDDGLRALAGCRELQSVSLQRVSVGGEGVAALRGLPRLTELVLLSDRITQAGIDTVATLEQLETLGIGDVSSAEFAAQLARLPRLENLAVVRGTLTARDMQLLSAAPRLQQLDLLRVHLPGDALAPLEAMPGLKSVYLARCEYDREGLRRLQARRPDLLLYRGAEIGRSGYGVVAPGRRRLLGGIPLLLPGAPSAVH